MATVNYYLDKPDKKGYAPIHLRINCNGKQIKISTGAKVIPNLFDKDLQLIKLEVPNAEIDNHYLSYLKKRALSIMKNSYKRVLSSREIKLKLNQYVESYKESSQVKIVEEVLHPYKKTITFIDLFAGAGGFSEGLLQASDDKKIFDFILASDINENCELTHIARYNHQLGLNTKFLRKDITDPDYMETLLVELEGKRIDVICGGPPCQSFSLAGRRKKFDEKDTLFSNYLTVIKAFKPKYFVMENVKGILTKEKGKIKELILKEINSILDIDALPLLINFVENVKNNNSTTKSLLPYIVERIKLEQFQRKDKYSLKQEYIKNIEARFKSLTPKMVDYKQSKTDININTIRHGLALLKRDKSFKVIKHSIIKEIGVSFLDNDEFIDYFNQFLFNIEPENIINKIKYSFSKLDEGSVFEEEISQIITALNIYIQPLDDCIEILKGLCNDQQTLELQKILDQIRLYRIDDPLILNASDYGVPQNRERVIFIGCRKDQKLIKEIPSTVKQKEKVSVFEALYDLNFVENNQEVHDYE